MATVYLMRHGKDSLPSIGNIPPEHRFTKKMFEYGDLNETGIEQVRSSAGLIRDELIARGIRDITIYHSPVNRVVQSAQVLAGSLEPVKSRLEPREELRPSSHSIVSVVRTMGAFGIVIGHEQDLEDYTGQSFEHGQYRVVFR